MEHQRGGSLEQNVTVRINCEMLFFVFAAIMIRTYIRKRPKISPQALAKAITIVERGASNQSAAELYGVSSVTLHRRSKLTADTDPADKEQAFKRSLTRAHIFINAMPKSRLCSKLPHSILFVKIFDLTRELVSFFYHSTEQVRCEAFCEL